MTTWPIAVLAAPVKLVVWDLDDTFWSGTLSEGPVALDPALVGMVRTLNRRGIVNAICSKNDEHAVRTELEAAGLWDEFVFVRVDWAPKGPRVAAIIDDAQLRPENVLFIDDRPANLGEAAQFAPGLQTAGPEILRRLLDLPQCVGKDDRGLSRLAQYRVLERKVVDRRAADGSHEEFLRSCSIRVALHEATPADRDRLHELSLRTNQLNFTKRRPTLEAFESQLSDPDLESGYVVVSDRYGDYGISGFYARHRPSGTLLDFLFSCRVMSMGVEQWLYDYLGRPGFGVEVPGDVTTSLVGAVDWISLDDGSSTGSAGGGAGRDVHTGRILIVGGCDLSTTADFLGGGIATEFAHPGGTGAFIHAGHSETIRLSATGLRASQDALLERLPMVDHDTYRSAAVIDPDYDVLVLSVLTDYTQGLYRHKETGLLVPWNQFTFDVTDPANRDSLVHRHTRESMDADWFAWFAGEFEYLGGIEPERFQENIAWLAGRIPDHATLILVNGAEFPLDNPKEPDRHLRHREMNEALDRVVADLPNARVCDVRTFLESEDDFTDHIRHYRRRCYLSMAEEIRTMGAALDVQPEHWTSVAYAKAYRFAGRRRLDMERLTGRTRRVPVRKR